MMPVAETGTKGGHPRRWPFFFVRSGQPTEATEPMTDRRPGGVDVRKRAGHRPVLVWWLLQELTEAVETYKSHGNSER